MGFAFVASAGDSPLAEQGFIHTFHVSGSHWRAIQTLPTATPAHLEPHPELPILYVTHTIDLWQNLPRGAVSAYDIHRTASTLTLRNTQPLSLSAIRPRHAAVSPDGKHLLVAAGQGGLYNLLPIASDGTLGAPAAIRKEHGAFDSSQAKIAHPRHVIFHPSHATALTADTGQESISLFSCAPDLVSLQHRVRIHPGAGPSQLLLSPSGSHVYALHAADGSIAVHPLEGTRILPVSQSLPHSASGPAYIAMHPNGRFLVRASADTITSLAIDSRTGHLSSAHLLSLQEVPRALAFTPDANYLLSIDGNSGRIRQIPFHAASGALGAPQSVAQVEGASSILYRPA